MLKFSLERIWKNPLRNIMIILLLLFPSLELTWYIFYIMNGGVAYAPHEAFFLRGQSIGIGHIFQAIYLWLIPIYCLIIVADDCLEDNAIGYNGVLCSRCGKREYIRSHIKKSFIIIFTTMFTAFLINILFSYLLLRDGQYSPHTAALFNEIETWEIENPLATNILHGFITALISGILAVGACITALLFKEKRITYFIVIFFWLIQIIKPNAIILLFQPRTGITLEEVIITIVEFMLPMLLYVIAGYIKVVRFDTK